MGPASLASTFSLAAIIHARSYDTFNGIFCQILGH